jgi:hypothetical protein
MDASECSEKTIRSVSPNFDRRQQCDTSNRHPGEFRGVSQETLCPGELRVRCSSDLPRHPSAAIARNLVRIQKRRNDIQETAYRLALVETF